MVLVQSEGRFVVVLVKNGYVFGLMFGGATHLMNFLGLTLISNIPALSVKRLNK